ncbi:MAG: hypothetical protein JSR79_09515, partial [Proteobacteria bacterium]|nr:hypothetical protein [Pseudomonadota bacterium]
MMTVAIAATTVPLTPSGKWVVDYQPHNCIASRTFGVSPADVGLALTPMFSLTADKRTFLVLAPAKGGRGPIVGNAKMTFLPSRRETQVSLFSWVSGTRRLYELGVTDDASLSEAARSTGITIATGQQVFSFATGNLAPVLDALTECTGKLLVSWGVDPSTLVKDRPERQQWFPPEEYPK